MFLFYFDILYREDFDKCRPPDSMVGHLFQNYDTIHLTFFIPLILAVFPILRFFPSHMSVPSKRTLKQTSIFMRYKKVRPSRCTRWRHRIIPSAAIMPINYFMYDKAEK